MSNFKMDVVQNGTDAKITVFGLIDESSDFRPYTLNGIKTLELHLGEIAGINSCGIREWIKWISLFKNTDIIFHECPSCIMDQVNMIQGFLPMNAKILSFYVAFYSDETGTGKNVLFTYGNNFTEDGVSVIPTVLDDAGNSMEMDVIESKYFRFLKRMKPQST